MATCLALTVSVVSAADNDTQTSAYQASVAQEQIRGRVKFLDREISKLLDEFQNNPVGENEVKRARGLLEKLRTVGDTDMQAVAQLLRDASREENADKQKALLVRAGDAQKKIQLALQDIVDQLAVQRDEVTVMQRLFELTVRQEANRRETQNMAEQKETLGKKDMGKFDWNFRNIKPLTLSEQQALGGEITLTLATLKRLAEHGTPAARQTFALALMAANKQQLTTLAEQASADAASDYAKAAQTEAKIVAALKEMLEALNMKKQPQERLRDMALAVKTMAARENAMARQTPHIYGGSIAHFTRQHNLTGDSLSVMKDAMEKFRPESRPPLEAARQSVAGALKNLEDHSLSIAQITALAELENRAADNLTKLANELQTAADKMGGAKNTAQNADGDKSQDAQMQALNDAMNQAQRAKQHLQLADRNLNEGGRDSNKSPDHNRGEAQKQMDAAKGDLAKAMEQAAQGGVPEAKDELQKGGEHVEKAKQQAGGGDSNKAMGENHMAMADIDKALAALKQAANARLASQSQQNTPQQGVGGSSKDRQPQPGQVGDAGPDKGGGSTESEDTDISAVNNLAAKDRASLLLLQKEKAPAEYGGMIEQYQKNLANGELPGQ